ncbi:antitoxin [Rhodococcus aerolatus]
MSLFDKAKKAIDDNEEKVDQALDKVGDAAKKRFAGHDAQIDEAVDKAQEMTGRGAETAREHRTDRP